MIGLGQPGRGDDAVGPAVSEQVRRLRLPGVRVIQTRDPAGLPDLWGGSDVVVVADAVRSGRRPGTVHVLDAGHGELPVATGAGGTHGLGLAQAVELARALGRLPPELVIVGVEAQNFGEGLPLSPPVRAAVATAVRVVAAAVRAGPGGAG